jgi:hypothetical protein
VGVISLKLQVGLDLRSIKVIAQTMKLVLLLIYRPRLTLNIVRKALLKLMKNCHTSHTSAKPFLPDHLSSCTIKPPPKKKASLTRTQPLFYRRTPIFALLISVPRSQISILTKHRDRVSAISLLSPAGLSSAVFDGNVRGSFRGTRSDI